MVPCSWWTRVAIAIVCLALAAVFPGAGSSAPQQMLRIARGANARSLDPHINARLYDRIALYTLYEPLIDADDKGSFVPVLARSWDFGSTGRVATFHLREGVTFHDGTPFTAEVVKWNIERVLNPDTGSEHRSRFEGIIQGVQVVDRYTVRIFLTRPYPALLSELTDRPGMMVSPESAKKSGKDFGRMPVGTGPFKFVEWLTGNRVVVERYDRHWNRPAIRSAGMVFYDVPEPAVADARLKSGELDLVTTEGIPRDDILWFQKQPEYRVLKSPAYQWESIQMKVDESPFDNLALRQAISYAINREQIRDVIYRGVGIATGKFFHEGWWADPKYEGTKYDSDAARRKLKESGYADKPVPLTLYVTTGDTQLGEMLQAQMAAVGIRVNIRLISEADQYPRVLKGEIPFTAPARWTPRIDPHGLAYILWDSRGYANSSHYRSSQVDAMLDEASQIYDTQKRAKLYRDAERMIVNDASYVFYYASPDYALMKSAVRGFRYGFDLIPRVSGTWVER